MDITLSPDLVPPSVKIHVEQVKRIMNEYLKIYNFMNDCITTGSSSGNQLKGMYLEALCVGTLTVLTSVNETLMWIKENVNDTTSNISWLKITNECDNIGCILTSFNTMIDLLKSGKFRGCKILDLCDSFISCGSPPIKHTFIKIQRFCLNKLYIQTKLWLMQAVLHDPHNDFFIKQVKSSVLSQDSLVNKYTTNSISSANMTNTCLSSTSFATFMTRGSIFSHSVSFKYEVNADNLPSVIPFSVAVKMLFIGEALIMCRNSKGDQYKNNLLEDCGISEESIISQFEEIEKCEIFVPSDLYNIINDLWIKINKRIRVISEEIGNISDELVLMSDIFLLGRGYVFQEFLLKENHILTADVRTVSSQNLNKALREAFYNVYLTEVSDMVNNFYFVLPNRKSLKPGIKTISVMSLGYNVKWPLHYLFTQEVMKSYNKLFRFLLTLKNSLVVLTSVGKCTKLINEHSLRKEFIEVKMHLLSIIVNLQNYCFTNVITQEMNLLLSAVKNTDLFTDLQKIFSSFLYNVSSRLFISSCFQSGDSIKYNRTIDTEEINKKVFSCFMKIFELCDSFYELLNRTNDEDFSVRLSDIKTTLYKILKILFSLLEKIDQNVWYDDNGSGKSRIDGPGAFKN
nr:gamma-tubulin complex component 4 [Halyomorpha halys]